MTQFMLLTKYGATESMEPMTNWDPEDIKAHLDFLQTLNQVLTDSGELVGALALTGSNRPRSWPPTSAPCPPR